MNPTNNFSSALERAKAIAAKLKQNLPPSQHQQQQHQQIQQQNQQPIKQIAQANQLTEEPQNQLKKYVPVMKMYEIMIPSHMAPLVLGRGGETMKSIEIACNVEIELDKGVEDGKPRKLTIRGEELSVEEAQKRVDDIVHGSGSLSVLMGGQHRVGEQTIYVQVPANRVGLVIGRGGETIKALQDRTGARINVVKEEDGGPNRTVVVAGTPNQLALAQAEIDDIVHGTGFAGAVYFF